MRLKGRICFKPLGTFGAVVTAESGKVLCGLGLLPKFEMSRREEIGFDLIDVSICWVSMRVFHEVISMPGKANLVLRLVLVMVRWLVTPIVKIID